MLTVKYTALPFNSLRRSDDSSRINLQLAELRQTLEGSGHDGADEVVPEVPEQTEKDKETDG